MIIKYDEQKIERAIQDSIDAGLRNAAFVASELIASSMPGRGAAVIGKTRTNRNIYRPAEKGQPPGVRTARLKNSITFARLAPMKWAAGTNVRYGFRHEDGHHPFMQPTVLKNKTLIGQEFAKGASLKFGKAVLRV